MRSQHIQALWDAVELKRLGNARREHRRAIQEAKSKVRRWERKAKEFDGEIHHETLARMKQRLREVELS